MFTNFMLPKRENFTQTKVFRGAFGLPTWKNETGVLGLLFTTRWPLSIGAHWVPISTSGIFVWGVLNFRGPLGALLEEIYTHVYPYVRMTPLFTPRLLGKILFGIPRTSAYLLR